jgi:hypothetical protein
MPLGVEAEEEARILLPMVLEAVEEEPAPD